MAYSSETFYQYTVLFYVQSIHLTFFYVRESKGRKVLIFGPNAVIMAPTYV